MNARQQRKARRAGPKNGDAVRFYSAAQGATILGTVVISPEKYGSQRPHSRRVHYPVPGGMMFELVPVRRLQVVDLADKDALDGVQGDHGGTLVRGEDHVEVELVKDGKVLERVRVACASVEQARSVAALARLWGVVHSEPGYLGSNLEWWRTLVKEGG